MSLPAPILTLIPLTPLTPLFGRKRALLGGGGRGEGPLPGGEGGGWSPNGRGVRGGEGTPRVHGQARASRQRFLVKRGVRVPIFVLRVGVRVSFRGRNPPRTATGFGACSGLGPTSVAVSVLIPVPPRPWGGGANRAPTAPPIVATVGRRGETSTDRTLYFRHRGGRPRLYRRCIWAPKMPPSASPRSL